MNKAEFTEDRICTVLKEKLYSMADCENAEDNMHPKLKWIHPINSTEGMISILENAVYLLGYAQEYKCGREDIDRIIQNEVYPVVCGLRDEFDFVLACVILVMCKEEINFTDEKEVQSYEVKILRRFIEILEWAHDHYDSFTDNSENQVSISKGVSDEYMDTSGLEIGMVVKNYKEMCLLLRQEIKNGKSKKLQMKDWERYLEWEKSGQKFIITDIYDMPLKKEDKRKLGNNSVYVKYIELILLQYLSKQDGYTKTFTKRNWWELLGMVNRKYNRISKKCLQDMDYTITPFEINHFYQRCNKKLEQILFSALNNLKNRKLLLWEMQTVIVDRDDYGKEGYFLANDEDKKRILEIERYVLKNVMGYEKMFQVFCHFKQNEYYRQVNEKLYELYGWHHYFKQIKMIYTQKDVLDAIQQSEIDLQKAVLNEKIIEVLNDNAKEKYDADKQKWEETRNNLIWGDFNSIAKSKAWNIPETYLEAQRILTDELINIGHKNKKFSLDHFEEDDELNQLFTSFMC